MLNIMLEGGYFIKIFYQHITPKVSDRLIKSFNLYFLFQQGVNNLTSNDADKLKAKANIKNYVHTFLEWRVIVVRDNFPSKS